MKKVRIKQNKSLGAITQDIDGCKLMLTITKEQVWTATLSGKYWALKRKGIGCSIRLTDAAFRKYFQEVL